MSTTPRPPSPKPKYPTETVADRAWLAYLALPRDDDGNPPSYRSLEGASGSGRPALGTLSKLFSGERVEVERGTAELMAAVLRVSSAWLLFDVGDPPPLVGDFRPIPLDTGLQKKDPVAWRRRYGSGAYRLGLPADNWSIALRFMGDQVSEAAIAEVQKEAEGHENDVEPFEWGQRLVRAHHRIDGSPVSWRHAIPPKP